MMFSQPRLRLAGDAAILIEWADEINDDVNDRVHAFAQTLRDQNVTGITDLAPAYSSLLVCYDPGRITHAQIVSFITERLRVSRTIEARASRLVEIPTRYGGEFGPDLEFIAKHNKISEKDVIRFHASETYRVYMLGFAPGFAYLGSIPKEIVTPRLDTPRTRVPAGSVAIAGRQTGVYPFDSPGGWRIIGRAELKLFDITQDPPALLRPGDRVRFIPM